MHYVFLCNDDVESVGHFLIDCIKYQDIRSVFFTSLAAKDDLFFQLSRNEKLRYILDVRCPEESIASCCKFLLQIYEQRKYLEIHCISNLKTK